MFLKITKGFEYTPINKKKPIPNQFSSLYFSPPPRNGGLAGDNGYSSGVSLVAQYIEYYYYLTKSYQRISNTNLKTIFQEAIKKDQKLEDQGIIDAYSEKYPSCGSIMQAFIDKPIVDKPIVTHTNGVGHVRPDNIDDIKYLIRQYGAIILEFKASRGLLNYGESPLGYDLSNAWNQTIESEDVTKGFIAMGYNGNNDILLQNNLGVRVGSIGFHKIRWTNNIKSLCVGGCFFRLT